jgi:hypothetical protein
MGLIIIDPPHSLLVPTVIFTPNGIATNPPTIPATSIRYAMSDKRA